MVVLRMTNERLRQTLQHIREAVAADYPAPVKLSEIDDLAREALESTAAEPKAHHCASCQCPELERAGFVDPTPPHLLAQGYRSGSTQAETRAEVYRVQCTCGWQGYSSQLLMTPQAANCPACQKVFSRFPERTEETPCLICGKPWHSGHTAEERKACDDAL